MPRKSLFPSIHPLPPFLSMCAYVGMDIIIMHVCWCEPVPMGMCVEAKGGCWMSWCISLHLIQTGSLSELDWQPASFSDSTVSNLHPRTASIGHNYIMFLYALYMDAGDSDSGPCGCSVSTYIFRASIALSFHLRLLYQESLSSLSHHCPR